MNSSSNAKKKTDFYLDSSNTFMTDKKGGEAGKEGSEVAIRSLNTEIKDKIRLNNKVPNSGMINETYDQIGGVLDTLNQRVQYVIDSNQDVFISAYRNTMDKMGKELKEMKYKMSADKIKEKQEQKLKLVEKERDWFRDEALRLNRK